MKRIWQIGVTALAVSVGSLWASEQAIALFDQREVDANRLVLIASPYGEGSHQLLIVEQISNARPCWGESGQGPTVIEPLLANFDFTGICGRSTDSNGYSIRMAGEDLGLLYNLRVVKTETDLLLVATPLKAGAAFVAANQNAPEFIVGRANGFTPGFAKLVLEPGWRLTRRTYQGKSLGHIYLTHDQSLTDFAATLVPPQSQPTATPAIVPTPEPSSPETPSSDVPLITPSDPLPSMPVPVPTPQPETKPAS